MDETISSLADSKPVALREISCTELENSIFSPGDIFWVKKSGARIKILGSGDVIDHEYLKKFDGRANGLQANIIADISVVGDAMKLFLSLSHARTENERIERRMELMRWFKNIFWIGSHRGSLLDLVKIGTEVFYKLDVDTSQRLTSASNFLFKRSALVAPMAVFICLGMGYLDFNFLRDLYHLCFLFDFALDRQGLSYNLLKATELERRKSGDGIACLFLGDNPGPELEAFQFHPRKGMLEAKELCSKHFTDPNLINLIMKHHERVNGKGFPFGINEDEMSDLDTIIIFLNHLISYDELSYSRNDGQQFLKNQLECESGEDAGEIFGLRLKDIIIQVFDSIPDIDDDEVKKEDVI